MMVDHLWQSTLFAAAVWVAACALRRNSAAVRYRLWMAASLKFVVPFSALVSIGSRFASPRAPTAAAASWPLVVEEVFSPQASAAAPPIRGAVVISHADLLPVALVAIWAVGSAAVLLAWGRQWRALRRTVARATTAEHECPAALDVPVMLSSERVEPGLAGIVRPVLLLPSTIRERVPAAGLNLILAHEFCHLRRRDNLTAALHMAVEAIF